MHLANNHCPTITKMDNRVGLHQRKPVAGTGGIKCKYYGFIGHRYQQTSRLDVDKSERLALTRKLKMDFKEKTQAGCISCKNLGCQNIRQLNVAKIIINRRQPCGKAYIQHLLPYSLVKLAQVCLILVIIRSPTTKCQTDLRLDYFRPEHVSGEDNRNMLPAQPLAYSRASSHQRGPQHNDWKFPKNIKEIITSNMDTSTEKVSTTAAPPQRHQMQQKKSAIDNNKALALLDHTQSNNDPTSTSRGNLVAGYLLKRATDALNEANNKLANQTGTTKMTTTFPPIVISSGDKEATENLKRKESFGETTRPLQEAVNQTASVGRHSSQLPDNSQQQNNVLATKIAVFGNSLWSQEPKLDEHSKSVQKQKFTIKANGKELALELPSLLPMKGADPNHLLANGLLQGQRTKSKGNSNLRKKDNRIGEFLNSDDESGFDEGETAHNSASSTLIGAATIDLNGSGKPHPTSPASQSNLEPSTAPSSSSSSLMSTRNDNENDGDGNDESKSALSSNGAKLEAIGRNGERGDNNIISEWSKSGSRPLASVDRHSSKLKAQSNSRFSTLISGGDGSSSSGLDDDSNHSREPQALHLWDFKQSSSLKPPVKSKLSNKMANATTASTGDKESGFGKGSVRRHTYPKAPVFAKARYAPLTSTKSSYVYQGEKSAAVEESLKPGKGESNDALNVRTDKQSSYLLNGFSSSPASSNSPLLGLVSAIRASTHSDKSPSASPTRSIIGGLQNIRPPSPMLNGTPSNYDNHLSVEQPGSTFEYKANYTNLIRSLERHRKMMLAGPNVDDGKIIAEVKAPTVQRDVSYKNLMQPFTAPNYQSDLVRSLPLNQDLVSFTDALHQKLHSASDSGLNYQQPLSRNSNSNSNSNRGFSQQMNKDINSFTVVNQNLRRASGAQQPLHSMVQPVAFPDTNRGLATERTNSIIRMGPIMPHSHGFVNHHHHNHLKSLVPAAVALLAHAQEEQHNNHLKALISQNNPQQSLLGIGTGNDAFSFPQANPRTNFPPFNLTQEQMVANSNHLGVSHLGPQSMADPTPQFGMREFTDRNNIPGPSPSSITDSSGNLENSNLRPNAQGSSSSLSSTSSNLMSGSGGGSSSDEQRIGGFGDVGNDNYSYEPNSSVRMNIQSAIAGSSNSPSRPSTSRSSISDVYYGQEPKSSREAANGGYPMRSGSVDPYEDISTGISTSEYERDLADLDEEFNRNTYRRPPSNPMMSDSYMNMSPPERYEGGRGGGGRYSRRPSYDYSQDYMGTTGSMSSILPRSYHRQHGPHSLWSSASTSSSYGEPSDLWSEAGADFSPVASYNPYTYKWSPTRVTFPRYSRTYSPYITAAATESHPLSPYSMYSPSYTSAMPTETVSFTLSPLAAAAAAAASALAAADKSRHNHAGAWLTIPRLATTNTIATPVTTSAATNTHPTTTIPTVPPPALPTAYIQRPYANPYALASMPFYAIAPRQAAHTLATATGATGHHHPSIIPYPYGGTPALFAYRPAGVPIMPSSLLTAASFAYPMRLPMVGLPRYTMGIAPTRAAGSGVGAMRHPFYSDLQFAETKPKTNSTSNGENGSGSSGGRGLPIKTVSASFTAMARNLTRKMFGQASQIRPLHVAPPQPNPLYDFFTSSHNSTFNF